MQQGCCWEDRSDAARPQKKGRRTRASKPKRRQTGKAADLVFKNDHVQTLVNEGDVAQAVAVRGGDIVYVGDDAGIEAFVGDATKVIDLGGKFLCPGFMDGHLHGPQPYYEELFQIAIPEGTMDNEEYLRSFGDAANCCDCGVCEMFACPMGLSPRKVNGYIKGELRKRGIQVPRNMEACFC